MFQNGVGCRRPQDTECPKGAPAPVATSLHGQPSRLVGPQAGPVAPAMPGFTSRPGGERGSTSCFSVKNSRKASDLGHLLLLGPVCVPSQPGLGHMTLPPLSHCEVTSRAMVVAGLPLLSSPRWPVPSRMLALPGSHQSFLLEPQGHTSRASPASSAATLSRVGQACRDGPASCLPVGTRLGAWSRVEPLACSAGPGLLLLPPTGPGRLITTKSAPVL